MKSMLILFHAIMLLVSLSLFSQPLLAEGDDENPVDRPVAPTISFTQRMMTHLSALTHISASTLLVRRASALVDGVISLVILVVIGIGVWLVIPPRRLTVDTGHQPPSEIPPLRPVPGRVIKF